MADPRQSSHLVPPAQFPAGADVDNNTVRPRNRRLISTESEQNGGLSTARSSSSLFSSFSASASRKSSPMASTRSRPGQEGTASGKATGGRDERIGFPDTHLGMIESSLTQSWSSIQGFASSLMSSDPEPTRSGSRAAPKPFFRNLQSTRQRTALDSWGPSPPDSRPAVESLGVGSLAERQAALRAAKTASVLESHEGVNGGLDVSGRYKRRTSDDYSASPMLEEAEPDQLVYIHHVQPTDTYAGIVLRYRCREEPFRKLNGLWSKDIQARKWLALPVDFCEVKGRACQPPSQYPGAQVDLLAPTPDGSTSQQHGGSASVDDFFSLPAASRHSVPKEVAEDKPWQHVRWCSLDMFSEPVEIARVSRKAMGYFPPRRKKSLHTTSATSTPRQSLEQVVNGSDSGATGGGQSPKRPFTGNSRHGQPGTPDSAILQPTRSRMGSAGADSRPTWMRGPGGVGSMGRNVRAPGPEKDYFNTWAKRHLPGIAIDEHSPSISVMGSETAHFGFSKHGQDSDAVAIVQSPFDEGAAAPSSSPNNFGLDRAAAQIETWLRGAFAKGPGTPNRSGNSPGRRRNHVDMPSDLIELEDASHDDPSLTDSRDRPSNPSNPQATWSASTSRPEHNSPVRSRK